MAETMSESFMRMKGHLHVTRRIPIDGELESKSLTEASRVMALLDFESDEPITLLLSSGGGSYDATLQFCDTIAMLNSPVDVIVYGDCCSCAVDIVQNCRKRMLLPGSRMLVHYIRSRRELVGDDPDLLEGDIAIFRENMAKFRERRFALYEKRTGLSREKLATMFRHGETHRGYFSADQAVEMKLADEVIIDFKLFPNKKYEKKEK